MNTLRTIQYLVYALLTFISLNTYASDKTTVIANDQIIAIPIDLTKIPMNRLEVYYTFEEPKKYHDFSNPINNIKPMPPLAGSSQHYFDQKPTRLKNLEFRKEYSIGKTLLLGGLGIAAGILNHEGWHQMTANSYDVSLDWNANSLEWTCENCQDSLKAISIAGLTGQGISSEMLLRTNEFDINNPFRNGWLLWNTANSIYYVGKDQSSPQGFQDLANLDRTQAKQFGGLILIHTGTVIYRWLTEE